MELDSSCNKQLRREITARVVMNKQIKLSEVDKNEKFKKLYDVDIEITRIKKTIGRRRQKNGKYTDLSLRLNVL